jgi:zinc D-Ala-D-Ala carboxypeptidase
MIFMRFAIIAFIVAGAILFAVTRPDNSETSKSKSGSEMSSFDKNKFSVDDPSSFWVVVNKKRPLPSDYAPVELGGINGSNLRVPAVRPAEQMIKAAAESGHKLQVISGYRSYADQQRTYNSTVSGLGQAEADKQSARAGHSEHQTGLALDLGNGTCDLEMCFGDSEAGKWIAANAHKYGFILRYQKDKESITGYQYEPWHLRYVGNELAIEINKTEQTLEEFFSLPPAPNY